MRQCLAGLRRWKIRYVLIVLILMVSVFDVLAFTRQYAEEFSGGMGGWDRFLIGDCGGQNHYTSGGQLHMRASYGTDCFGAYYRENNGHPGTFPTTEDMRVVWRWRYLDYELYGTQAGQLTGRYGWPQYYGMSGVDTHGSTNDAHVLSEGPWGTNTVGNPLWRSRTTSWHVSTFDWMCDGVNMRWYMDGSLINQENSSAYYFPPGHESRPYQFWMGNLLDDVPSNGDWTPFDLDYVYVYAVQRPQMNTPTPGSAGVQTVSWNTVPNTTQPDGSTWPIQYQVRACNNAGCSNVQSTSGWLDGTSHTFTGLPLQRTYTYQARARWVGTPELITCWGNTVSADMSGEPALSLSKTATAQQDPGDVVQYSLTLANTGDAPANGVVIRDPIPGYITTPTNITNGGSVVGNEIQWNIGTLNNGGSVTVRWQGTINSNIPRTVSQITNMATVTDNAGHSDTAQATTTILLPDMSLSKSATSPVWPGADIDFTITLQSSGQGTLRNIVLRDPIPPYVNNVRNISDGGTVQGGEIVWNLSDMNPGSTNSLSWRGTIDQSSIPASHTQIVNTVSGTAATGVSRSAQSTSQVLFPHMSLAKHGPPHLWPTGNLGSFVYTMTVTNDGQAAMMAPIIRDPLPNPYVINVDNISHGGVLQNDEIVWNLSDMNPGESVELSWEFGLDPRLPADMTEQINTISGTAAWWDINATASAISEVGRPNMRLTKIAPTQVWPNADIAYTILVENRGNAPMAQTVITDTIPHYVTDLSGISHSGDIEGDTIIWRLPDPIAPGERVELTWHGRIDPNIPHYETEIINVVNGCALVTCDSTEVSSVLVYPAMLLDKSAPPRTAPGEMIDFVITVQNTGQAPMYDVVISDPLPDYVLNPDVPAGQITGGNITWQFAEMAPGEIQTLTWSGEIDGNIPDDVTTLINKVYGTALAGISEYAETTTVILYPTMSLSKWATPEVWAGSLVEYRLTVRNTGGAVMEAVEIRDRIPDYVLDAANISGGGTIDRKDIVWYLGDMAPGASFELTWEGTVDPYIPTSRSLIRNQVQGLAARGISDVAEATSLVLFPSLVINKSGTLAAAPGDTVQFVIEVQNASAAPVEDVVIKDFIPDTINDPANISYNGYVEGKEIIWEIGSLTGGESLSLIWEGTIDLAVPLGQKYIDNIAEICDGLERYCDNALYRLRLLQADARVTKDATPYGWPGSEVDYSITVHNTGETTLQDVIVRDPLPQYVLYPRDISHSGAAVESPFEGEIEVVWVLDDLAPGELVELSWRGTIAQETPVKVDAIENIATLETRRGVQRGAVGSTYVMHPELRLLKRATEQARPGEPVAYSITLENPSWIPAYDVDVHDIIPSHILTPTGVSHAGEIWADEVYWHLNEIAAGQVVTLSWQGIIDPQVPAEVEEIVNTVRAADMTGVEAESEAVTDLVSQDIVVRKTADYAVQPGGGVAYHIELENRSDAPISSITITDPVPQYVLTPDNITGGGSLQGNSYIEWNIPQLEPGEHIDFSWQGIVDKAIPAKETVIWNEVSLTTESGLAATARAKSFVDQPLLQIDKTATVAAGPSEPVTYTLVIENLGRAPAYAVEVHDPIPPYLSTPTVSDGGRIQADEISWDFADLAPGQVLTLSWSVLVDPLIPPSESEIINTATVLAAGGQVDEDQAVTRLHRQQAYLAKGASPVVYPGGTVVYTLTVENRGQADLYDVVVIDPLPEQIIDPGNISGNGRNDGNDAVRWEVPLLTPGQVITLSWQGTVDPQLAAKTQIIWNEATVLTGSGLETSGRAKSLVRFPVLVIAKSATLEAGPGDLVDYLITIQNLGQAPAYGVEVYDPIPDYVGNVTSGDADEIRADAVTWYFDQLAPGESRTLNWNGEIDEAVPADQAQIVNIVTVQDGAGNGDTAQAVTHLRRQAIGLDKNASPAVYPGGSVVYTVTLQNGGDTTLYGVTVTDPVPQYVLEPANISAGGHWQGNTAVVWEIPALAVGEVLTMSWQGTVDRAIPTKIDNLWNEATATTAGGLAAAAQAQSRLNHPALAIAKSATVEAGPGEQVTYTILVGNTGAAPAYEVEVEDPIPTYIVSPGGAAGAEIRADAVRWLLPQLAPGETRTLSWFGFVDPDIPATETTIVNVADVQDIAGNRDSAQAITNLPGQVVTILKDATYLVYPGGEVVYTITVRNRGDAAVYGLVVRDPVPEYVLDPRDINSGGSFDGNVAVVWSIPTLAAGQSLELGWRGTIDRGIPAKVSTIWNEATLTSESGLKATARAKSWLNHPELVIEKLATLQAGPGDAVDYTLTVRNIGAAPAYDLDIRDPLPPYIVSPSGAAGGQIRSDAHIGADEVSWHLDSLAPGEQQVLNWSGYVAAAIPPDVNELVNAVSVEDGAGNQAQAQAVTRVLVQQVVLLKTASPDVYPGGSVAYTMTVQNRGLATLYGVVVNDPIPEYVLDPDNISAGGYIAGNQAVVWELPAITPGEVVTLTWQGRVDSAISARETALWNEATLTTESGLQAIAQAKSLVHHPALAVQKSATLEAGPGEPITYILTIANPSAAMAYDVLVTDPIPAGIENVRDAVDGDIGADEVIWSLPALAPAQVITLSWRGDVAADISAEQTEIINIVTVQDGAGHRDEARAVTRLVIPQVELVKTASYTIYPGGEVVYSLTTRNRGDGALYGVSVSDPVPAYILSPRDISGGGTLDGNTDINWQIPVLNPGDSQTLSWRGTVDRGIPAKVQAVWNEATLTTASGLEASAQAKSLVLHPMLAIDKAATLEAGPGQPVVYTLTLRNPSQAPVYDVVVHDSIPAYIVNAGGAANGEIRADEIVWHLDTLAPGEQQILNWSGQVDNHIPDTVSQIINRVAVRDEAGHTDEAEATTRIVRQRLDLLKSASYKIYPGGDVVYTLTVRNRAGGALHDLTVTDPIPDTVLEPRDISAGGRLDGNIAVVWEIPTLAAGGMLSFSWTGTVDPGIPAKQLSLSNEATVTSAGGPAATAQAKSLVYHPSLTLDKVATIAAGPGEAVTYTLVVHNPSQAPAYEVEIHDPIPEYIDDPTISSGGVIQADAVYWRRPEISPGAVITLTWAGTVAPDIPVEVTEIANLATVEDITGPQDEDGAVTNIPTRQVELIKSAPAIIHPGGPVVYTITVRNRGQAMLHNLNVIDPLPEYILQPGGINQNGFLDGNTAIRWEISTLAPGQTQALRWQGRLDPDVPTKVVDVWNEATLTSDNGLAATARARSKILRPVLLMTKLAPAAVGPGETVTYTLILQNVGPVAASQVVVHDPIPGQLRLPRQISSGGLVDYLPTYEVQWVLGDLAPGERRTLAWTGTVNPQIKLDPATATVIENMATARDESGTIVSAGVETLVLPPQVELTKTAPAQAGPGEPVAYTLIVSNTGETMLHGLTVSDPVPDYLRTPTNINAGGRLIADEIIWTLGSLPPGETQTLRWQGAVDMDIPREINQIRNRATVTAYPNLSESAEATTRILRPMVALVKTGPAQVAAGDEIAYTLTVSNSGPVTLFDVTLTDPYPSVISPTLISAGGVLTNNHLIWSLGALSPGEAANATWQGWLDPSLPVTVTELTNRAVVMAQARVRTESMHTAIVRQPVLALAKAGPAGVQPGGELSYRIVLSNTGQATAKDIRIEDFIPTYVTPQTINDGGYEVPGRLIWTLAELAAGERVELTWQGTVAADIPATRERITNRVIATTAGGLRATAQADSALLRPQLTLFKQSRPIANPGGAITYTLHLVNSGDGLARNIEVRDPLPQHVAYVPDSATTYGVYQAEDGAITWSIDQLPPGGTVELGWQGQVAIDLPPGVKQIINRAEAVTADVTEPVTATVTTAILAPQTSIAVLCPAQAQAGDVLSYTLRLHNTGGTLTGAKLVLPLPAGTSYQTGSATHGGQLYTDQVDEWGDPLPDELAWDLDTLAYGGREQIRFALAASPVLTGHVIAETTLVASGQEMAQGHCETTLFVPVLAVSKSGPSRSVVNEIVQYRITVTNTGLVPAHHTVLTDTILPGIDYLPGSASHDAQVITVEEGGEPWQQVTLVWNLGDLPPGAQVTRTFRGQMYVPLGDEDYQVSFSPNGEAQIYNEVQVTADRATPAFATVLTLVPRPGLQLTRQVAVETNGTTVTYQSSPAAAASMAAGPAAQALEVDLVSDLEAGALSAQGSSPVAAQAVQVWPGSRVEHILTGVNQGPGMARQAMLVEQIPAELEVIEASISDGGSYDPAQHAIIWPLGDLAEGQQVERSYALQVPISLRPGYQTLANNQAKLSSPDAPTAYASAATTISGTFEVAAVKLATDMSAPGGTIDYIVRLRNISPNPVDQVTIHDSLPDYTSYITGSASLPPQFSPDGRSLTWNLGMLDAGETRDVHFQVQVASDIPAWLSRLQNEVTITFSGGSTTASAVTELPLPLSDPGSLTPTPTPDPGVEEDDGDDGGGEEPPPATLIPPRSTAVVPPFGVIMPTGSVGATATAGPTIVPSPTPLPAPGLHLAVSPQTVQAGEASLVTWRLTFTNPTPLLIGELVVRDLLPQGLLYVGAETSQGQIEVSPRSAAGQDTRIVLLTPEPTVTTAPTATLTPTITVTALADDLDPADVPILLTPTVTSTPAISVTPILTSSGILTRSVFDGTLPQLADVPLTEVVFHIGEVPPGGRIQMVIETLVLPEAAAGTVYENIGTYAAANVDPGISNKAAVEVIGVPAPLLTILPVTGGWLELIDPRTPQGQVSWGVILGLAICGGLWLWWRRR